MYIYSKKKEKRKTKEKKEKKEKKWKKKQKNKKKKRRRRRKSVHLCIVSSSIKCLYRLLSVICWVYLLLGVYVRFFLRGFSLPASLLLCILSVESSGESSKGEC